MPRTPEEMNRAELVEELSDARLRLAGSDDLQSVIQDLSIHQEELRAQQRELVDAQHQLELSRDRYAQIFDLAPLGYATLSEHGVIVELNLTGAQLLGVERARVQGMPFVVYVHPPDRRTFLELLGRCRRGEPRVRGDLALRGADRSRVPVELTLKRAADRGAWQLFCAFSDQHEREQLEQERRRAADEAERLEREQAAARAASEAKDRFLAVLSHELRSPLAPVVFGLAALEHQGPLPESVRDTLDMIRRNVDLETRLIDDLLDVTRIQRGKLRVELEEVDLHELVRATGAMISSELEAKQQRLRLRLGPERAFVLGDPTRLRQVFWNLLQNASHATPDGGEITIEVSRATAGRLTVTIDDTGPGISPDDLERIFVPFEQAASAPGASHGLGLGLAISKGLVEAHGGTLRAANLSRGARFTVELDAISPREPALGRRPSPAPMTPRDILLVEDHADTAEVLSRLLASKGCRVRVAHSVAEALAVPDDEFEIVLSDVQLPDATGLELMRRLRERRDVPGIAMSGFGFDHDVRRSLDAGFRKHLIKPVKVEDVLEAIDEVVGR